MMGRFEVTFRKFAILSGVRQEAADYAICVQPPTSNLQRRGTLMLMAEPAGLQATFGVGACKVAQEAVINHYYGDHSLSLTSGLINALDSANNTLLQYNYEKDGAGDGLAQPGAVAVQGGGVATRKARVGLTAVLVRPDGAGIYVAQTAPAQLYIVHNGLLSAIPQPQGWDTEQPRPQPISAGQDADSDIDDEELVIPTFQAAPLGSRPGVEADLIFRRVETGDTLVAVSSSLAKRLERVTAERLFIGNDADTIIEGLHTMAVELGCAEAHACVLELGTDVRSGVETDYKSPLQAPQGAQMSLNGGANVTPIGAADKRGDVRSSLPNPRQWLQSRKNSDSLSVTEGVHEDILEPVQSDPGDEEDEAAIFVAHPTGALVNRSVERPPFQVTRKPSDDDRMASEEELEFDGWEDTPPALPPVANKPSAGDRPEAGTSGRILISPARHYERPMTSGSGALQNSAYKVPTLFELALDEDVEENIAHIYPERAAKNPLLNVTGAARQAGSALITAVKNLAPERTTSTAASPGRPRVVPAKVLIAGGVLILSALLIISVLSMTSGGNSAATTSLLEAAKQEDLLANQPNLSAAERKQHLTIALEKAKEARSANPDSNEAQLLVANIQGEIDKVDGVTRLPNVRELFDLASISPDAESSTPQTRSAAPAQVSSAAAVTGTVASREIIVHGNDAFIMDSASQKVYRCKIAAQTCSVVMTTGDTVGGQKVGTLSRLTSRVTNVVALDEAKIAYIFDPDTNAWQAEPLGDSAQLQTPKDIATYDGNLYLLDAKPGQVSKYSSGAYSQPPDDWIKDTPSAAQLKEPLSMAIDGVIYVVLRDGKIVTMQGGKVARTISPRDTGSGASPTDLFTSTDTRDLYLLKASEGSITRISKDGQTLSILKAPAASAELATLDGMTVDEGRGKLYLISGTKVYESQLPGAGSTTPADGTKSQETKPDARPTAAP